MSVNPSEFPAAFSPSEEDPAGVGRGTSLEDAINNALKRAGATHGEVHRVDVFVSVSNPHIGEYIVALRGPGA